MHRSTAAVAALLVATACAQPSQESASPRSTLARFAHLTDGPWQVTLASGRRQVDSWRWGPGRTSLQAWTEGRDAAGNPWRRIRVLFWDSHRQQLRLLGLSPNQVGPGIGLIRGTVAADHAPTAVCDLYQGENRRQIEIRWAFESDDLYRETLLERHGFAGTQPLGSWDYARIPTPRPQPAGEATDVPATLRAFAPLLGATLASDAPERGSEIAIAWIPHAQTLHLRGVDRAADLAWEAFIYPRPGRDEIGCLVLHRDGTVDEGTGEATSVGAQFELDRSTAARRESVRLRLDAITEDGRLRQRTWRLVGGTPSLAADVTYTRRP